MRVSLVALVAMAMLATACGAAETAASDGNPDGAESTAETAAPTTPTPTNNAGTTEPDDPDPEAMEEGERGAAGATTDEILTGPAPSPDVLAAIDAGQATWEAERPSSYSAFIHIYNRDLVEDPSRPSPDCGARGMWVTVEDGVMVQARDTSRNCDVPLENAPTLDDVFAQARVGGAGEDDGPETIEVDEEYGFIRQFLSSAQRPRVIMKVDRFWPEAIPIATDPTAALAEARASWAAADVTRYTLTLDIHSNLVFDGPMLITVTDGAITDQITASARDPEATGWPLTVVELFDAIEADIDAEALEVAFHPDLGFPVFAFVDPVELTQDDEVAYFVIDLQVG